MSAINLSKGERINLSKSTPGGLSNIRIGLRWAFKNGQEADLDASVVVLGADDKMLQGGGSNDPRGLCFYNNKSLPGITHQGDALTGGDGNDDNEVIDIDLDKVENEAQALLVVCTTYSETKPINFGVVSKPKLIIYNKSTNEAMYSFELDEDASNVTAVELGRLYRKDGDWRFTALAEAHGHSANGLADILAKWDR